MQLIPLLLLSALLVSSGAATPARKAKNAAAAAIPAACKPTTTCIYTFLKTHSYPLKDSIQNTQDCYKWCMHNKNSFMVWKPDGADDGCGCGRYEGKVKVAPTRETSCLTEKFFLVTSLAAACQVYKEEQLRILDNELDSGWYI